MNACLCGGAGHTNFSDPSRSDPSVFADFVPRVAACLNRFGEVQLLARVVTASDLIAGRWAHALIGRVSHGHLATSDFGAGRSDPLVIADFIPGVATSSRGFVIAVSIANF